MEGRDGRFSSAAVPGVTAARAGATGGIMRASARYGESGTMPRFVILEHDHPVLHWDLMLESGAVLRTWRLAAPPCADEAIAATATFDHRPVYLDHEGPVRGGRGQVVRRESGMFAWQTQAVDRVVIRLDGAQLRGILRLEQMEGDSWRGEFIADSIGS